MAYQPAMVPPKKSKRVLFIVLGVVLALCCSGGAVGAYLIYRVAMDATGPVRSTVNTFAGALVERDYPTAYQQLCTRIRDRVSEADFTQQQENQPDLTGHKIVGLNLSNQNGHVSGSATVRYTKSEGGATNQVYPLIKEEGNWRICE
ncbi:MULTISPECIES: Rv0361 family membrane protein [Micromonospora]|uniref:Rv0361 family membrane protein n=1 Tax=Micromonospora TaxID=1873 RepID=UPI000C888209|nr:hypothetical protein [Verrucosispora sp. ts21]PMR60812.1 hypothetical protein C1A38_12015 [Verrucosispora sp. ts21]